MAKKKALKKSDVSLFDPLEHPYCFKGHTYALDVVAGKIPNCKYIIAACSKYLREVETVDASYFFDKDAAEKYLRLVQKFSHVIGHWHTENIVYEPWQCWVWMNIMGFKNKSTGFRRFRVAHVDLARGGGKAHWVKEKVPTPDGIKLWEEISIGSRLYDRNGNICKVVGKTPIHRPDAYKVTFSDGTETICSGDHLWVTSSKNERTREARHRKRAPIRKDSVEVYESVRTTREMAGSQEVRGEPNYLVRNTKPILGGHRGLPVHPYLLGYWIGNGHKGSSDLSCHAGDVVELENIFKNIEVGTHRKAERPGNGARLCAEGLLPLLRLLGVLNNKHVPKDYLFASYSQRLDLLRGLMDSDGSISEGKCEYTSVREDIAYAVLILARSFGYKATISNFKVSENNNYKSDNTFYRVFFIPRGDIRIFNLKRKADRQVEKQGNYSYCDKRYIKNIENLDPHYDMFCVEVDSPDNTYLITDAFIPTHNSLMASQCVLYMLALDNPKGNQISTVATKRDQARIVLDSSRVMAMKSESFLKSTGVKVLAHTIIHDQSASKVRALSSDANGLDGLQDVLAVTDELHAMRRDTFDVIYSGMSKRKDSLTLCITTAGDNLESVGYTQRTYAIKVAMGEMIDDQFFSAVYTLDEDDDIYSETSWIKANPNWGVSVDPITFIAKAEKAKVTPADVPNFKIKHLNMWLAEAKAFFDVSAWNKCADPSLRLEDFAGKKCYMAADLASKIDLSSLAYVFKEKDEFGVDMYYIFDRSYLPEDTVKNAKNDLYLKAAHEKHLIVTKGAAIHFDTISGQVVADSKKFKISDVMVDPWNSLEFSQRLMAKHIETTEFKMNVGNFSEPTKTLDALIREGRVRHNGSVLLQWCIGNVVCTYDVLDNVLPKKTHEKLKIDPIVAIIMALAGWMQEREKFSKYESDDLLIL